MVYTKPSYDFVICLSQLIILRQYALLNQKRGGGFVDDNAIGDHVETLGNSTVKILEIIFQKNYLY